MLTKKGYSLTKRVFDFSDEVMEAIAKFKTKWKDKENDEEEVSPEGWKIRDRN